MSADFQDITVIANPEQANKLAAEMGLTSGKKEGSE